MPEIPARMRPAVPMTWPRSTFAPAFDLRRAELSVQRKRLRPVIDDDEVAVAGERAGERDRAVMNGAHGRPFFGRELHTGFCRRARDARAAPAERCEHAAVDRPFQIAAERPNRQRRGIRRRARHTGVDGRQRLLQFDLRALQLARELGGEIAAPIDLRDELRARDGGAFRRSTRNQCRLLQLGHLGAARVERGVRGTQLREILLMAQRAGAIDGSHGGHHAVRAAELLRVGHVKQQAHVAGAAELVELHHARFEHRPRGGGLGFERVDLIGGVAELEPDFLRVGFNLFELLVAQVAFDFEAPQIDEQGALLRRQGVGLALQRDEPLARAARLRLGARPVASALTRRGSSRVKTMTTPIVQSSLVDGRSTRWSVVDGRSSMHRTEWDVQEWIAILACARTSPHGPSTIDHRPSTMDHGLSTIDRSTCGTLVSCA